MKNSHDTDNFAPEDCSLTEIENALLRSKNFDEGEIDEIELNLFNADYKLQTAVLWEDEDLAGDMPPDEDAAFEVATEMLLDRTFNPGSILTSEGTVPITLDDLAGNFNPELDRTWRQDGLRGIILLERFHFVDVPETFFTCIDWRGVQAALMQLELRPMPRQSEIESILGSSGFNLPSFLVAGVRYFDFEYLDKPDEEKRTQGAIYAQVREAVLRNII